RIMKAIFDTMVFVNWHLTSGRIPEKWEEAWCDSAHTGILYIAEPLISEVYYQIAKRKGHDSARNCITKMKSLKGAKMFLSMEDDELAIEAACIRLKSQLKKNKKEFGTLSMTDAYLVALARKMDSKLFTTDHVIRDSAREHGCKVDWLPKEELT